VKFFSSVAIKSEYVFGRCRFLHLHSWAIVHHCQQRFSTSYC